MSPETLERIFDPYFTTKDVGKGSGLGLAVVLAIIKRHGGAITPGKGSTLTVYFPSLEPGVELIMKPFSIKDLTQMVRRVLDANG